MALALVAVVFGVHSALDWTWFVPAVAITGLFCAGWVAGRGALFAGAPGESAAAATGPAPLAKVQPMMPRGRGRGRRAALLPGVVVLVFALLTVGRGERALALRAQGKRRARARRQGRLRGRARPPPAAPRTSTRFPPTRTSSAPRSHAAAGDKRPPGGRSSRRCGCSPPAPRRGGGSASTTSTISRQPARAVPVLRAAVYLDPFSQLSRNLYVVALRAEQFQNTVQRRPRAKSVPRNSGTPPPADELDRSVAERGEQRRQRAARVEPHVGSSGS